uniref:BTB/POZ domain-containing protein At5g66560-like n=1 Tax=Erigeron canadensis TaxID=72917 RepID=UPI001CB99F4A|nr:BTB/POZ domain-containing protein At5g66560-like [Erigeron canadensis]
MQESSKRQAWFCTTGLPSDVVVDVGDMAFHLHKFPLMAKSKKLHELITEHETNPPSEPEEETDEIQEKKDCCHITLPDFPGGAEAFEAAAKFCYTGKIELSPSNVALLRCTGEILEMTEEFGENNLISKTERFLSQNMFKSLRHSIKTLKTCQDLLPLSESIGIVQRCIDSIVSKASASDPALFGWPVNEHTVTDDKWFDELVDLNKSFFNRLITAIKSRNPNPEIVENCLISYAKKHIPGVSRVGRRSSSSSVLTELEQKELLETIVTNLPEATGRLRYTQGVSMLFGMLRAANILKTSDSCRANLETKIGVYLDQAALDDLLIPSYSYLIETLYDVECVQRILDHFLHSLEQVSNVDVIRDDEGGDDENRARSVRLMLVGKLIDGYLSEIASDTNLKPEKFLELAFSLPEQARVYDDGLYRSVDVYLKAHPWIKEVDREKVCGAMDCRKLTLEACTHAAQNERLPLRAVVQVLFFEQLQLRQAIAGTLMTSDIGELDAERIREVVQEDETAVEGEGGRGVGGMWTAAVRQNQVLRLDMDSMRTRVHHLERECSTMRKAIKSMDEVNPSRQGGWRESIAKKFSCKFKTQVCDSHEPTIVEARKGRTHGHQKQQ